MRWEERHTDGREHRAAPFATAYETRPLRGGVAGQGAYVSLCQRQKVACDCRCRVITGLLASVPVRDRLTIVAEDEVDVRPTLRFRDARGWHLGGCQRRTALLRAARAPRPGELRLVEASSIRDILDPRGRGGQTHAEARAA